MLVRQTSKMARLHMVMSVGHLVWHRPFHRPAAIQLEDLPHLKVPSPPCIVFWQPSSYQLGLQHVAPYRFRKILGVNGLYQDRHVARIYRRRRARTTSVPKSEKSCNCSCTPTEKGINNTHPISHISRTDLVSCYRLLRLRAEPQRLAVQHGIRHGNLQRLTRGA